MIQPTPPPAEPGLQTTEFWITTVTAAVVSFANVAAAFGLHVTSDQKAAILAALPAELTLLAAVYTVARSWRKRGTSG